MIKKLKNFLRDIFAPRIVVHKYTITSNDKNFPKEEFNKIFEHTGKIFDEVGNIFKKL